jgi:hypothetical protein
VRYVLICEYERCGLSLVFGVMISPPGEPEAEQTSGSSAAGAAIALPRGGSNESQEIVAEQDWLSGDFGLQVLNQTRGVGYGEIFKASGIEGRQHAVQVFRFLLGPPGQRIQCSALRLGRLTTIPVAVSLRLQHRFGLFVFIAPRRLLTIRHYVRDFFGSGISHSIA